MEAKDNKKEVTLFRDQMDKTILAYEKKFEELLKERESFYEEKNFLISKIEALSNYAESSEIKKDQVTSNLLEIFSEISQAEQD